MEKIDKLTSKDIIAENIEKLKALFPTAFSEDKLILNELAVLVGKYADESDAEYYRMTWAGKNKAQREANTPSIGTLRPAKDESKNWDTTENIFIEGDNLEVLKLLQKSYNNRIKMIYIDPPYNTGKDFVYKDSFQDNLQNYLELTGQVDEEGKKLSTNTDSDGRYHSNWLNMMYPRLKLARNLLTEDGVIFISIDDNEQANVKKLCDEIFGEENFIANVIIDATPKNDPYIISTAHEYALVYTKNLEEAKKTKYGIRNPLYDKIQNIYNEFSKLSFTSVEEELDKFYKQNKLKNDNISNYKYADDLGVYRTGPIDDPQDSGSKDDRINPRTGNFCKTPSRGWSCSIETWNKWIEENLIHFPDNDNQLPSKKTYITTDRIDVQRSYFKIQTRKDSSNLKNLLKTKKNIFSNPKPIELLKEFIGICQDDEFICLDFFAGSGSSAVATMDLNLDGKKRSFISVQLPEQLSINNANSNKEKIIINEAINYLKTNNKPTNIAEIAKERLRLEGKKIKEENKDKEGIENLDIGFKVFKLDSSNIIAWDNSVDALETQLDLYAETNAEHIKQGRTTEDILYEILLKYGLDLSVPIEEKHIDENIVYNIGAGTMFVCLDDKIEVNVAKAMGEWFKEYEEQEVAVIFKDSAFKDDATKTNVVQTLKQFGIDYVKSI